MKYKCGQCGASGVKLWRGYMVFGEIKLTCAKCTEKKEGKTIDLPRYNSCGWSVPAIPHEDNSNTFYGYLAITQERLDWWFSLPT